jgi:ATP-dependent Lon protease
MVVVSVSVDRIHREAVTEIPTIPGELFAKFQTGFYADPTDAIFKALGVG